MKTILHFSLIFCLPFFITNIYAQNCSQPVATFDAAPGGYSIQGSGLLESYNDAITLTLDSAFNTLAGPDLHAYLAIHFEAPTASGNTNVDLGGLASNSGAQSFNVPAGVSLGDYSYVLIHCKTFNHWWGGGLLGQIDCSTSTTTLNDEFSRSIYPNPSSGIIHFSELDPSSLLQIYDFSGKLISSEKDIQSHQLDLHQFGSGIYFLKLINENGSGMARVLVD
ncbi:MAG: T9SS type A sorting domain-containing protein [Saprospiraceae bacterium]